MRRFAPVVLQIVCTDACRGSGQSAVLATRGASPDCSLSCRHEQGCLGAQLDAPEGARRGLPRGGGHLWRGVLVRLERRDWGQHRGRPAVDGAPYRAPHSLVMTERMRIWGKNGKCRACSTARFLATLPTPTIRRSVCCASACCTFPGRHAGVADGWTAADWGVLTGFSPDSVKEVVDGLKRGQTSECLQGASCLGQKFETS